MTMCIMNFHGEESTSILVLYYFFLLRDVRGGVPGERLKKYIESKLQDPSQRALSTVLQKDPVSFLKSCKTM